MNTLDELNEELAKNQDMVYFALFYDRKNKKFLAAHRGDDAIIEKMLNRAATTNNYFASMFSRISKLFSPKIPRPQNDVRNLFDIFDKFK